MVQTLNREFVEKAVSEGRMLTLTTHAYSSNERDHIDDILNYFLAAVGRPELQDKLAYCVHELANNAKTANTKRVYFTEHGLDLYNEPEYWVGMRGFRRDTVANVDHYLKRLKEAGLYIKVQFKRNRDNMMIAVRNNVRLTAIERRKIEEKIVRSGSYGNMAEAYASIEDTSEGAGLGIVMMIFTLRSLNLGESIIRFFSNERETFALLTIPVVLTAQNTGAS